MRNYREESFYQFFIRYCAPTMASLKCSNMMSCPNTEVCKTELENIKTELECKGIAVRIMYENPKRLLVLVYRPSLLAKRLEETAIQDFLREYGYHDFSVDHALEHLKMSIAADESRFPHEIGVFLGYPLADIRGFIANNGKNDLCCGEWKVYHEPEQARKVFDNLKKCRDMYLSLFTAGTRTLIQLTVAA